MRLIPRRTFLRGTGAVIAGAALPLNAGAAQPDIEGLVRWYNREFFDFNKALSDEERGLVHDCVRWIPSSRGHVVRPEFIYSLISFSHRVRGDSVNPSRLLVASIDHAAEVRPRIAELVRARGVNPSSLPTFEHACGVGWDVEEDHLKVYMLLPRLADIKDAELRGCLDQVDGTPIHDLGLASVTIAGTRVFEKKIYVATRDPRPAPVRDLPFARDIIHTNLMVTTRRGIVPQVDVRGLDNVPGINAAGRHILDAYRTRSHRVDTIAYHGADKYTLYFP